jgi:hypothetical protein
MQNLAPAVQCTSGPDKTCQFAGVSTIYVDEYEGRYYCGAHAPLSADFKITSAYLKDFITHTLQQAGRAMNLYGVVFPALPPSEEYNLNSADMDARFCEFEDGTVLQVSGNLDISDSRCRGNFEIKYGTAELKAHRTKFLGNTIITCNGAKRLEFTKATAEKEFTILGLMPYTATRMSGFTLSFAPSIDVQANPKSMPQDSNFRGLELRRKTAFGDGAEGRYRAIRNLFNASRDREQEGVFYMYEKRALRKNSSLKQPNSWIPRIVSTCYDWLAGYGQSYERAFGCFVGMQVLFAIVYSCMSGRFEIGCDIDSQVVAFTLAQTVRPFEFLSTGKLDHWPYAGIYVGDQSAWWIVAIMLDTVLSLTLVALFLLALRWRFRRD